MSRILLVDDDPALLRVLSMGLGARGHTLHTASNGNQALAKASTLALDVIVLDLGLPDVDGLQLSRRIREFSEVPILVLSADGTESRKVAALDGGADDYMTKPFGMEELEARLRLIARHWQHSLETRDESRFTVGALTIDRDGHWATWGGAPLGLTPREFELLAYLVRHAGKVLTHRTILTDVWGPAFVGDTHYLRVYVHRLRQLLGDRDGLFIRTEPGVGYCVVADVPPEAGEPGR